MYPPEAFRQDQLPYKYISSKMSGLPNYNFDGFQAKKRELICKGFKVWNPAEHEPDKTDAMWSEYLAQDIIDIENNCDSIYMWGKWYRSQGACVEMLASHRLGCKVEIEQWWLKWVGILLNILFEQKQRGFINVNK